jgi:hypothetical protein
MSRGLSLLFPALVAPVALPAVVGAQEPPDRPVQIFPRGDLFRALAADPKEMLSFVAILRVATDTTTTTAASVAFGESVGVVRFSSPRAGRALELGVSGAVFAQFDLSTPSNDLLNTDFLIGAPITAQLGPWSARVRYYHQSSHLGDELLLRSNPPVRVNLSFESLELLVSRDLHGVRVYGGGEYLVRRDPPALGRGLLHGGLEARLPGPVVELGGFGDGFLVLALDVRAPEERDWQPGWSATLGLEFRVPGASTIVRRWGVRLQGYTGPVPYGQFYTQDVTSVGVGLHFAL